MNMTTSQPSHLTDDQLVLLYYREPLEEAGLDGHLAACASCAARFAGLTRILAAVAQDDVPEPAGDFEARMTAQVLAAAKKEERGRLLQFPGRFSTAARFLAAGAALAACLIIAFSVGRRFGHVEEQTLSASQRQERILMTALGEHLGRSRVTLVELKNREVSDQDLRNLQAAADNLVAASRLFRAAAERAGEGQIAGVMEETERLLLRFAAAPEGEAKHELDGLRAKVDSRDLLFRLQVMEAQVEKRGQSITPSSKSSL
ncbi:MAG: hypothetical protein K1Y01_00520 [Vicinamibacteria bacterium]|nr:hypothetical protein [Vicinamibacteria bacterium]